MYFLNTDLPAVITLCPNREAIYDGLPIEKALRRLEELGADVVGMNCYRGPDTILPLVRKVRAECKVRVLNEDLILLCKRLLPVRY